MTAPALRVAAPSPPTELWQYAPVAALVVDGQARVRWVNAAAESMLGSAGPLVDRLLTDVLDDPSGDLARAVHVAHEPLMSLPAERMSSVVRPVDGQAIHVDVHLGGTHDGSVVIQIVEREGRPTDTVALRQQRAFRTALLELSQLTHEQITDAEFYDTLVRRAVAVVPGAQTGSILLRKPGTDEFHFVAAVGFALEALQRYHLMTHEMFRDISTPSATISQDFVIEVSDPARERWMLEIARVDEIVTNVAAPVFVDDEAVAFISLDNFDDLDAFDSTSIEMTTVLGRLIADLLHRRDLEAQLRRERESFRHLALHDELTGLPNRRHLEAMVHEAVIAARRAKTPIAVLFADLDGFKQINDQQGHDRGDQVLAAVADELRLVVRAGDIVGRWGGDEFVIVAPAVKDDDEARRLAQRFHDRFLDALTLPDGAAVACGLSIGVAVSEHGSDNALDLVQRADRALYRAKQTGAGVVMAPPTE